MRVVVDDQLPGSSQLVQSGHAISLLAAASGHQADEWAQTTLIAHQAPLARLVELILCAGGEPGSSGTTGRAAWFCEPDLLFAPTALAVIDDGDSPLIASIAELELVGTTMPP